MNDQVATLTGLGVGVEFVHQYGAEGFAWLDGLLGYAGYAIVAPSAGLQHAMPMDGVDRVVLMMWTTTCISSMLIDHSRIAVAER